jgi:hypothetical protein
LFVVCWKTPVRKKLPVIACCFSEGRKLSDACRQWEPFVWNVTSIGKKAEVQDAKRLWTVGVLFVEIIRVLLAWEDARETGRYGRKLDVRRSLEGEEDGFDKFLYILLCLPLV